MVDLTPAGDAWLSPDYLAVGLALAASFALARYGGSTWIVSLWLTVGRVARRPLLVLIGVALLAGGVAIALSALRLPVPLIQARISDFAVVPYRQDQSPRLDFWGSDVRNLTTEGDTRWVNYNTSHFSSRSTAS